MNHPVALAWSSEYAVGVPEIDEQHMILVHTLNDANVKLRQDCSQQRLEQITQDLLSYALYHFETEEELMQEFAYADASAEDAAAHLEQHRQFSTKVVTVREQIRDGVAVTADELIGFLTDWLVNHIMNTDKRLAAHIRSRRGL